MTSVLAPIGYSIIAVPTGIYTAELADTLRDSVTDVRKDDRQCPECSLAGHDPQASFCRNCAHALRPGID